MALLSMTAVTLALLAIGCGGGEVASDAGASDASIDGAAALTVIATRPEDQAVGVDRAPSTTATFSRDIAADTLDESTFTVTVDGAGIAGTVSYTEATRVARFDPADELALLGTYTATVTSGVTDVTGAPLAADRSWSFTVRDREWGNAQVIDGNDAGDASNPQVAVDATGNATVVWSQSDGTRNSIWANRYVPDVGWGVATLVESDDAGNAGFPQVVVDGSGVVTAVWQQYDGGSSTVRANRYLPGTGWGTATLIETPSGGLSSATQLAVDAAGAVTVVWEQYDGTRSNIWANHFVPQTGWDTATLLETDDAGTAGGPAIAVDPAGNAMAVWSQSDGIRSNIWSRRLVPEAGWDTATLVETANPDNADMPQVIVDGAGIATAVWRQFAGVGTTIWANRYVPGGGWGTAAVVESASALSPQLAVDSAGNVMAVWTQLGAGGRIWTSRYVAGSGWGTPTVIEPPGRASSPQVAIDASGNAFAVWSQFGSDIPSSVWASRHVAGVGWDAGVLIDPSDAGGANHPQVAVDPAGNATAVWWQSDGTGWDIYANTYR